MDIPLGSGHARMDVSSHMSTGALESAHALLIAMHATDPQDFDGLRKKANPIAKI